MPEPKLQTRRGLPKVADLPPELAASAIHRKYKLGKVLHTDFAGTLYAPGLSISSERPMAVKVLSPGYAVVSSNLGTIEHSRICRIRNTIIERDAIQAVIHEIPTGKSLTEYIRLSGPLSPGQAVLAILQLLSAVHAVHWHGAVAGNLHADSVYLSRDKHGNLEIQLANLGIGCAHKDLREQDYLAPEQIMGAASASVRSDIWAAGALLYQMIMGRRPFPGENRYAVAGEILLQELSFKPSKNKIPDTLVAVIRKAMEKDEKLRYESVSSMVAELMPMQESFNEPMSRAAAAAIKDSVPPAGGAHAPRTTPKPVQKARAIPTVRISHTPAGPPTGHGTKKDSRSGGIDRSRPVMQTKLGMPAISIPPKHIPLKSKEDTSTFVRPKSEPPLDMSAYTARKSKTAASKPPAPDSPISKDTERPSAQPKIASPNRDGVPSRVIERLKTAAAGASQTQKRIAAAGIAGFSLVLLLLLLISGEDSPARRTADPSDTRSPGTAGAPSGDAPLAPPKPNSSQPKKAAGAVASPETQEKAALPADDGVAAAAAPPQEDRAEAVKPVEKVKILLKGRLPSKSTIRLNGEVVEKLPFFTEKSDEPVTVTVEARGFETFESSVVPDRNRSIRLDMKRAAAKRPRGRGVKPKPKTDKSPKPGKDLASNPFGE